jgi:hypothetical protein
MAGTLTTQAIVNKGYSLPLCLHSFTIDLTSGIADYGNGLSIRLSNSERRKKWQIKHAPIAVASLATRHLKKEGLSTVVSPVRTVVNVNADALMNRSRQNSTPP